MAVAIIHNAAGGHDMRNIKRILLLFFATLFITTGAAAQDEQAIFNLFGGIMRSAISQQSARQWHNIPVRELACIDAQLRERGSSLQFFIAQGVSPSNAPIESIRVKCQRETAVGNPHKSPTFEGSIRHTIQGIALGDDITKSANYGQFHCSPSELFRSFIQCWRTEVENNGKVTSTTSILRSSDGSVDYISRTIKPAFFGPDDARKEIERLSVVYNERAKIVTVPQKTGLPYGIIASWGNVALQPLGQSDVQFLLADKSSRKGYLADFLADWRRSAQLGLPLYLLTGGAGAVWIATYDDRGVGELRFVYIDASKFLTKSSPVIRAAAVNNDAEENAAVGKPVENAAPVQAQDVAAPAVPENKPAAEPLNEKQVSEGASLRREFASRKQSPGLTIAGQYDGSTPSQAVPSRAQEGNTPKGLMLDLSRLVARNISYRAFGVNDILYGSMTMSGIATALLLPLTYKIFKSRLTNSVNALAHIGDDYDEDEVDPEDEDDSDEDDDSEDEDYSDEDEDDDDDEADKPRQAGQSGINQQRWYQILNVAPTASAKEINASWREKIRLCHPDRVAELDADFQALAEEKAKAINAARAEGLKRC